jgi:ABC-type multidrug transport system fused ATPase/permease subunit
VWTGILPVRAARSMHRQQFNGLFNAPLAYFWSKGSGYLLNRFSADVNLVETEWQASWGVTTMIAGMPVQTIVCVDANLCGVHCESAEDA